LVSTSATTKRFASVSSTTRTSGTEVLRMRSPKTHSVESRLQRMLQLGEFLEDSPDFLERRSRSLLSRRRARREHASVRRRRATQPARVSLRTVKWAGLALRPPPRASRRLR
jgi:hypothetical protein